MSSENCKNCEGAATRLNPCLYCGTFVTRAEAPQKPVRELPHRRCCFNCAWFGHGDVYARGCTAHAARSDRECEGCDPWAENPPPANWTKRPKDFVLSKDCGTCAKSYGHDSYCNRCDVRFSHSHWLPAPTPPIPEADLEPGKRNPKFVEPEDIAAEVRKARVYWPRPVIRGASYQSSSSSISCSKLTPDDVCED